MTTHIQLFNRTTAENSEPLALAITGTLPDYSSTEPYEGRLSIVNAIGKCKVDLISGNLPPAYQLFVDNFNSEVVLRWTAFGSTPPGPVVNGDFEAGNSGWSMDPGWSIDENNDPRSGNWCARLTKTGDNLMLKGTPVPAPPSGFVVQAQGYIQQGASAKGRAKAQMEIVWRNSAQLELDRVASRLVDDGDGGSWSDEDTKVNANGPTPSGSATVAVEFRGWRTQSKQSLGVDDVTWNLSYNTGTASESDIPLSLKVTDSAGRTATWSGVITHEISLARSIYDKLTSWWEMTEASGTRSDSKGTNHLTTSGTVSTGTGLRAGQLAASFSASGDLRRAHNSTLIPDTNGYGCIFGWVRPTSVSGSQVMVCKGPSVLANTQAYAATIESSIGYCYWDNGPSEGFYYQTLGDSVMTANQWQFVVAMVTDEEAERRLLGSRNTYNSDGSAYYESPNSVTGNLQFGRDAAGNWPFSGRLQRWGWIKGSALTPEEFVYLYNAGQGRTWAELLSDAGI